MEVRARKGQAAVMDSLFMLLVVSFLTTMLYFFSANYGATLDPKLSTQYGTEYVDSALKTLGFLSVDRQPGIDYLLAMVKEDYYDDYLFDEYIHILSYNVMRVMEPISDEYDYVFYIYNTEEEDLAGVEYPEHFIYMQLNYAGLRESPPGEELEVSGEVLYFDEECILAVHPDLGSPHFPGDADDITSPLNFFELQEFIAQVPNSVASSAPLMFIRNKTIRECSPGAAGAPPDCSDAESAEQPKYMKMGIIMWPSLVTEKMDGLLEEWGCFDIEDVKDGSSPLECINVRNPDPLTDPTLIAGC